MIDNPFTTNIYEDIWLKHFYKCKSAIRFDFIKDVRFIKVNFFPIYQNIGKNLTNGMTYDLNISFSDFIKKVVIIYDVPDYFPINNDTAATKLRVKKVRQYRGLYADLKNVITLDDVLQQNFNAKSRSRFKGRVRQIESTFKISQKVFYGEISKSEYTDLMGILKQLIEKRFDQRKEFNTVIPIWSFYEELMYDLILQKKVMFNVIYDDSNPVAMSLNFVYDSNIVIVAIRTFDINYLKYNIGNYEIYKLFDWSIENNIKKLDFSKGEIDYKSRWSNNSYEYNHHILYDSSSMISSVIGISIGNYYKLKQYLRDKNINNLYVRFLHLKKKVLFQK